MADSPLGSPHITRAGSRPPAKRQPTRSHHSYDELSHAASAVARAAEALASSRSRRSRSRPKGVKRKLSARRSDDDDVNGGGAAGGADPMANSTTSLASDATGASSRSRTGGRTRTSSSSHQLKESFSSQQLAALAQDDQPPSPSDLRGRALSRPFGAAAAGAVPPGTASRSPEHYNRPLPRPSLSRAASRVRLAAPAGGRAKEAAAGLVLLSLVAVVGLRGLDPRASAALVPTASSESAAGRVIWADPPLAAVPPPAEPLLASYLAETTPSSKSPPTAASHPDQPTRPHRPSRPPPTWQRTVGRLSAWTCTVLYLTSRMPQIWKNVRPRSCLTHLAPLLTPNRRFRPLAVHAQVGRGPRHHALRLCLLRQQLLRRLDPAQPAHGPAPAAVDRIHPREPAVLAREVRLRLSSARRLALLADARRLPLPPDSGGTLCFDVCIVIQSLIYGGAKPLPPDASQPWHPSTHSHRHHHHHHGHRHAHGRYRAEPTDVEAAPLLDASFDGTATSGTISSSTGAGSKRQRSTSTGALANGAPRRALTRSRSRVRVAGADDSLGLRLAGGGGGGGDSDSDGGGGGFDGLPPARDRLRTASGVGVIHEDSESGLTLPGLPGRG